MLRLALFIAVAAAPVQAQVAISANDGKQVLVDGVQTVPARPAPDSVAILSLDAPAPRLVASVAAPASVIGPPSSVAIAPDGSLALVTSARRIAADPSRIEPDDRVSVIALSATPRLVATLHAGAGASGVAIAPDGRLALVANRAEGTLSVFALDGVSVVKTGTVTIGDAATAPAQPIFYDGGRRALVTRDGDHRISILAIEGGVVRVLPETLAPGLRPYEITTAGDRAYAVSANIGGGGRDVDTISLIDLRGPLPRVIDMAAVGLTPEGIRMAPDGRHIAVNVNNGSNAAPGSAHYHASGQLQIWRIDGDRLRFVAEAPIGGWGQGVAWSADGRRVFAQVMVERRIESFGFDGEKLTRGPSLAMPTGPAAIAVAGQ